jgi:uncharacterized protein with HEPN domain
MKAEDMIRIQHMIDAGNEALSFIGDTGFGEFKKNRMLILSVIKDIEILGEAASKITEETKNLHNEIPWKDIIGMRNRLIHGYFDVDIELVWNTAKENIPALLDNLNEILGED